MIRPLFIALLARTGKSYTPAPEIPTAVLAGELVSRATMLLRALIRLRRPAFMARGVSLRGAGQLQVGRFATIEERVRIDAVSREGVQIGARTKIGAYSRIGCTNHLAVLGRGVRIGQDCGLGQFSFIGAAGGVSIGNQVIMGQYVSFHAQQHLYEDTSRPIREQGVTATGITIEDDVWVGAKATFLDGAYVGAHSIVAAGAVVKDRFPPYSIIGGVPARLIRSRLADAPQGPE